VREVLAALRKESLVRKKSEPALTQKGQEAAGSAVQHLDEQRPDHRHVSAGNPDVSSDQERRSGWAPGEPPLPLLTPGVIASPLRDRNARETMGLPGEDDEPMPVMVELNLRYGGGVSAAFDHLCQLWDRVTQDPERSPRKLASEYATGRLSMDEMKCLVAADAVPGEWSMRSIHRMWPDFPVHQHIDVSATMIKVDAARRSFNSYGDRIVWAVVDSGVWGEHPHFHHYRTLSDAQVQELHRVFPPDGDPTPNGALDDETGHGTHVAGIIAGGVGPWLTDDGNRHVVVTENRYNTENSHEPLRVPRQISDIEALAGMSPKTKLVSLKVLQRGGTLEDRVSRVVAALAYVREVNAQSDKLMRIHGVNLSVGYEFDAEWFACGQSVLCQEVDKLVRSGVVVVVAAGNSGYGAVSTAFNAPAKFGLGMTINDPGNAERAITVGSTHRDMPHTYGVSYFSSKGPTGDGRRKPDLVAPGERITSCAAGQKLAAVIAGGPSTDTAVYVEETGTSMAAPHVSGAIAAFLSVRREFIGKPDVVKQIFVDSATPLGREPHFEGGGLVDLMRALQSI
jgi:serine protease AprX